MKLLFCPSCRSVFNLKRNRLKRCDCKLVCGRYDDNGETAVTNGQGYHLAIGNGSLNSAVYGLRLTDPETYRDDYYAQDAPTRITHAWIRPHEGPGNPHTRVDPKLGQRKPRAKKSLDKSSVV